MNIPIYRTIQAIRKQYHTGEEPVMVLCSDGFRYICKYKRSSGSSYKMVCELAGAILAKVWELHVPEIAFVNILPEHWTPARSISLSALTFGSRKLESVIDITSASDEDIQISDKLTRQILEIGLFDLWVANEDRNWNNANLLYDVAEDNFIVIDHGCIFNTATFDYRLTLLTENESILYSDIARMLLDKTDYDAIPQWLQEIRDNFFGIRERCLDITSDIVGNVPESWNVQPEIVRLKITELFDLNWMEECWNTFEEYVKESRNGKNAI